MLNLNKAKFLTIPLALALLGACSKSTPPASGIASWEEINSLAEAFVLRGDSDAVLKHTDMTGIPPEKLKELLAVLKEWHGVSNKLKLLDKKVMSLTELDALRREDSKFLPEDMRNTILSHMVWNINPEKVIVFTFTSNDPEDKASQQRLFAGTFRTNGVWYFSAAYSK